MNDKQLVQLLGNNWEKRSNTIFEYQKQVEDALENAATVDLVEYLNEVTKMYKWLLIEAYEINVDLADTDWGRALLNIFELTAVIFKKAHKHNDSLDTLLLAYLASPSKYSSRKYDLAEMSLIYGRHDILEKYFYDDMDLEILMANIFSAIMRIEEGNARFYFEELRQKYPDVAFFFEKDLLLSSNIKKELPKRLEGNDEFLDMLDRYHDYITNSYFLLSLSHLAKNPLDINRMEAELEELQEWQCYVREMKLFLKDIGINRSDYAESLVNAGITAKEDFKNYTKKEVLGIDGIGPKTIAKLEEAGVEFKEE